MSGVLDIQNTHSLFQQCNSDFEALQDDINTLPDKTQSFLDTLAKKKEIISKMKTDDYKPSELWLECKNYHQNYTEIQSTLDKLIQCSDNLSKTIEEKEKYPFPSAQDINSIRQYAQNSFPDLEKELKESTENFQTLKTNHQKIYDVITKVEALRHQIWTNFLWPIYHAERHEGKLPGLSDQLTHFYTEYAHYEKRLLIDKYVSHNREVDYENLLSSQSHQKQSSSIKDNSKKPEEEKDAKKKTNP